MVLGFFRRLGFMREKNRSLFILLFIITAVNAAFIVGWRKEIYFPFYIVACLWAALFYYWLFYEKLSSSINDIASSGQNAQLKRTVRFSVCAISVACVFWLKILNYFKVDRSGSYFAETL